MARFEEEMKAFQMALARAYDQGFHDGAERAKQQVIAAITGASSSVVEVVDLAETESKDAVEAPKAVEEKRKRAPKGLPRALTMKAMKGNSNGVTPQQIAESAETDFEKMIAISSIRSELRKGEVEDRYVEVDGLWHLADPDEAGGHTVQNTPPASNADHERKQDASSVASNVLD